MRDNSVIKTHDRIKGIRLPDVGCRPPATGNMPVADVGSTKLRRGFTRLARAGFLISELHGTVGRLHIFALICFFHLNRSLSPTTIYMMALDCGI